MQHLNRLTKNLYNLLKSKPISVNDLGEKIIKIKYYFHAKIEPRRLIRILDGTFTISQTAIHIFTCDETTNYATTA